MISQILYLTKKGIHNIVKILKKKFLTHIIYYINQLKII